MRHGDVAFALGGLAGNNAHGAGFLDAALAKDVHPVAISCTSGQIFWTYQYLRAPKERGPQLKPILQAAIQKAERFHNKDLDTMAMMLCGVEGVFRPDYGQYMSDWMQNLVRMNGTLLNPHPSIRGLVQSFPCRLLCPEFSQAFLHDVARKFQNSTVGIVFNSYNPSEGVETIHMNDAARKLLHAAGDTHNHEPGRPSSYRERVVYGDITAQAVLDGLWLYEYGFDTDSVGAVDGAYFRQIMLSELTSADTIWAVRPLHFHWSGNLPCSYTEMQDFKAKLGFNGSYAGERDQILLMNKLVASHAFKPGRDGRPKYHKIELKEFELEKRRGFFDYLFEDMDVYEDAFEHGVAALT